MSGPYSGLKVLDLSQWVSGPLCTRMLADMGAEVIRIEPRAGDGMRYLVPFEYGPGMTTAYAQYGTGKRSISVNLKSDEGRDIVLRLAAWADVVVQNFSPGAMERLGLGYEQLCAVNEDIILCSIAAFGSDGPYAGLAGFGMVPEAYSGLMALTGEDGGPPMHFGTPLADMNGGVHALATIGAALYHRDQTGAGTHIDLSLFDALFSMIDQAITLGTYTEGELSLGRYGIIHPLTVPSGVFSAGNGEYVTMAAVGDSQFGKLCALMGQPELATDAKYVTMADRVANHDELYTLIRAWTATAPDADELVRRLQGGGVMGARIRQVSENLTDPHLIARGTLQKMEITGLGERYVPVAPYRMSGLQMTATTEAPAVGADTDDVLAHTLDLGADRIAELHARGVVFGGGDP